MSTTPQPVQTQAAPAPDLNAAPPVVNSPAPAPNLPDALLQPGSSLVAGQAAPSVMGTTEGQGYSNAVAAQAAAVKKASDIANQPPQAPANVPHARLVNIISALSTGLSAAGASLGSHGREGGAEYVENVNAQQQQQKLAAQQATQAQRNQQIQQQLTIGATNEALANSYHMLMSLPTDLTKNDLQIEGAKQNLAKGALDIQTQTADFMKQNWGLTPAQVSGSAPTTPGDLSNSVTMLNRSVTGAAQILGKDNPAVVAAQQVAASPNPNVKDILNAGSGLGFALQQNKDVQAAQNAVVAGLPKNQQEAAAQLAAAQSSGDPTKISKAQSVYDATTKAVQDERQFASTLQAQNQAATKQITFQNTLAQKGLEDTNKLWTDPQHGFAQTRAQVEATKNIVAQAKNGSELAASLEPAMTVLGVNSFAGVHRISPTEYEAAGPQVGSLYLRLNALLDKAGSGKVPPATLSEVGGIMDALLRGKYQTSLDSTRQIVSNAGIPEDRIFVPAPNNFGALTTLDKIPVAATPTGNQAGAGVTVTDPRGVVHTFPDQASADNFKRLAGIK
jgi:hypothetical protein